MMDFAAEVKPTVESSPLGDLQKEVFCLIKFGIFLLEGQNRGGPDHVRLVPVVPLSVFLITPSRFPALFTPISLRTRRLFSPVRHRAWPVWFLCQPIFVLHLNKPSFSFYSVFPLPRHRPGKREGFPQHPVPYLLREKT